MISLGKIKGKDAIGVRVGTVVDKYKMSKHLVLDIRDDGFDFHLDEDKVSAEAALTAGEPTFNLVTTPSPTQQRAYDLLKSIQV